MRVRWISLAIALAVSLGALGALELAERSPLPIGWTDADAGVMPAPADDSAFAVRPLR